MIHLTAEDYRPMPWANGKGTTIEMLKIERPGFYLRLSRAMVVEDGAFSLFPGIERNLTVLSGPGFHLTGVDLDALPLAPVAFPGDVPVSATRVTTPCEDFNVMTLRSMPRPEVRLAAEIRPGAAALILTAGRFEAGDLVIPDQTLGLDAPALEVFLPGGIDR